MDETLNEKIFPSFSSKHKSEIRERIVEKIFVPNKSMNGKKKISKIKFFISLFFSPKSKYGFIFKDHKIIGN